MLNRQKVLLNLLGRTSKSVPLINLVKYCFLLNEEGYLSGMESFYQFLPYKFGPFSFALYHELHNLIYDGYISPPVDRRVKLLKANFDEPQILDGAMGHQLDKFWKTYSALGTKELVSMVYKKYPWFTINSKNVEKRAFKRPIAKIDIYTMGYEGLQIDEFLNTILKNGINCLIDVRFNPLSRKYGFHKNTLYHFCDSLGIEYVHMPDLGIPSAWRLNMQTERDYKVLFEKYENNILDQNNIALKKATNTICNTPTVLVCQEADPYYCHRTTLARRIKNATNLQIIDLGAIKCETHILQQECLLQ